MELKDRIKQLRLQNKLTQEQFGKIFGVKKSTISMYESGKSNPDDHLKLKMADYFSISMDYLMGRSDTRTSKTTNRNNRYRSKTISLDGLPDNAVKQVEEYVEFIRDRYVKKKDTE